MAAGLRAPLVGSCCSCSSAAWLLTWLVGVWLLVGALGVAGWAGSAIGATKELVLGGGAVDLGCMSVFWLVATLLSLG
jgi:hypothetical protein